MNKIVALPLEGNTNPAFDLAMRYAAFGWRVFPVKASNKKPWDPDKNCLMKAWQKRATTDTRVIPAWWQNRPDLGVAIATGRETGIVVLDFDKDKNKDGLKDKAALEAAYGKLPETLTQSTPSGGTQEFYRYPTGAEDVPNRQGFGYAIAGHLSAKLCGIDVRGDGGQVNVPPTSREAGAYRWHSDPFTTPLAALPAQWVTALSEVTKPERPKPSPFDDPEKETPAKPKGSAESVMAGCAAIERLQTDPKGVTEWGWKMSAGVVGRCERGRAIFHELSKLDSDRYSEAATDEALDYMLAKKGPHRCDAFSREMPDACAGCLVRDQTTGPAELAQEHKNLMWLLRRHVFVTDAGKFYDFERRRVKTEKDFSASYDHLHISYIEIKEDGGTKIKTDGRNKQKVFTQSKLSAKADTGAYTPGETRRVYPDAHGARIANVYLDDGIPAEPGDCNVWDDHFDWLLPNQEGQRDRLLDKMAFSLQQPNVKVRSATLLQSLAHQIGKGAIIHGLWAPMLGASNFVPISNAELRSQFQGGMHNKQLVFFDEVFIRDRDFYNETKTIITEPEVRSQFKFQDFVTVRPPMHIVASSNFDVPFFISEPADARWDVVRIDRERREEAYYKRLDAEGPRQIAAFKAKLLRRPLGHFNPAATAPMTEAKRRLIADSRSPLDRALDDYLDGRDPKVLIYDDLKLTVGKAGPRGSFSDHDIKNGLRVRGWEPRGQHKLGHGDLKGSFWTLGDEWAEARGAVLANAARWQGGPRGD